MAWLLIARSGDVSAAPRTARGAVVLTWCGTRGLATLALALSLPTTTADLPEEVSTALHERMARLGGLLRGEPATEGDRDRLEAMRRDRVMVSGSRTRR